MQTFISIFSKTIITHVHQSTVSNQVVWVVSSSFSAKNGVKQGGVLSPRLFNIYLDELLYKLKQSRLGCYYGKDFVGSLAYADDVLLMSPTLGSLNGLLTIGLCKQY